MSKATPTSGSGTLAAKNIAEKRDISEAAREWALIVALQKTEWHGLRQAGITTRLITLIDPASSRRFVGVFFACATDDLEADNDQFTFFVNGKNVDDIVAQIKINDVK
ncbi:MAG: hypothetical protein ONA90_06295 [candidate division KSB1 bacterium]|nr:hypothetical protein [candidate division KSB1 bacterium]